MTSQTLSSAASSRSRLLHWAAWAGAVVSALLIVYVMLEPVPSDRLRTLGWIDVALAFLFALEFFTRTGWKQHRASYLRWHWFDFVALAPIVLWWTDDWAFKTFTVWLVLVCRVIRVTDRTLGDGFVQRNALALLDAVEEEISDRVLLKIMKRIEGELKDARFGQAAAQALARNKEAVLSRIYKEQFRETGTLAKFANVLGLQSALERSEEHVFDSLIEMVGSPETDEAIRDVLETTLKRARGQIAERSWRGKFGLRARRA